MIHSLDKAFPVTFFRESTGNVFIYSLFSEAEESLIPGPKEIFERRFAESKFKIIFLEEDSLIPGLNYIFGGRFADSKAQKEFWKEESSNPAFPQKKHRRNDVSAIINLIFNAP